MKTNRRGFLKALGGGLAGIVSGLLFAKADQIELRQELDDSEVVTYEGFSNRVIAHMSWDNTNSSASALGNQMIEVYAGEELLDDATIAWEYLDDGAWVSLIVTE